MVVVHYSGAGPTTNTLSSARGTQCARRGSRVSITHAGPHRAAVAVRLHVVRPERVLAGPANTGLAGGHDLWHRWRCSAGGSRRPLRPCCWMTRRRSLTESVCTAAIHSSRLILFWVAMPLVVTALHSQSRLFGLRTARFLRGTGRVHRYNVVSMSKTGSFMPQTNV